MWEISATSVPQWQCSYRNPALFRGVVFKSVENVHTGLNISAYKKKKSSIKEFRGFFTNTKIFFNNMLKNLLVSKPRVIFGMFLVCLSEIKAA